MSYSLTPFGRTALRTAKTAYPRFNGCESGFRFFSPGVGRWCSRDPMWEHTFFKFAFLAQSVRKRVDAMTVSRGANDYDFLSNNGESRWDLLGLVMQDNGCACNNAPLQRYCLSEGATCGGDGQCKTRSFRGEISPGGPGIPYGWDQCICMSPAKEMWISFRYWFFWRHYRKTKVSLGKGPGGKQYYHFESTGESSQCCPQGETCTPFEDLGTDWDDTNSN